MQKKEGLWYSIVIGVGIAIAGISIGLGFYKGRASARYVTVRGLAEMEVQADLAFWPITFNVADNNLTYLQDNIEFSRKTITNFLFQSGFEESDISYSAPQIRDAEADQYASQQAQYRYTAQATVTTRSTNVQLVKETMESSMELVGKGVVLSAQSWENPTEFLFTGLNDIKPEMIEEATKNAREAAEKFATDSGSKVGKIRNATQGYFSIEDRDRNSPEVKIVRVVTTVQYFLTD